MALDEISSLDQIRDNNYNSKDGKFLAAAIVQVFEELKMTLENNLSTFQSKLIAVTTRQEEVISKLVEENKMMKKKISTLEEKIDQDDAYERKDSLIFSGKNIPAYKTTEDTASVLIKCLKDCLGYVLQPNEISVLHRLQENKRRGNAPDHRAIYVKFCRRSIRKDILEAGRRMKADEFYVNEALTPTRRKIALILRHAKRDFPEIVSGSSTFDGKNYVWVHPPNRNARGAKAIKHAVHTYSRLEKFCLESLHKPIEEYERKFNIKWDE